MNDNWFNTTNWFENFLLLFVKAESYEESGCTVWYKRMFGKLYIVDLDYRP